MGVKQVYRFICGQRQIEWGRSCPGRGSSGLGARNCCPFCSLRVVGKASGGRLTPSSSPNALVSPSGVEPGLWLPPCCLSLNSGHAQPLVYCLLLSLAVTMYLAGAVLPESSPFHVSRDSAEGDCPHITPKACCICRSDESSQLAGRGEEGGGCCVEKVEGLCLSIYRALCWSELPLGLTGLNSKVRSRPRR